MKKNALIFAVLLLLALVPVTCSFLFSGDDEDAPAVSRGKAASGTWTPSSSGGSGNVSASSSPSESDSAKVPVFKGFEAARYQQYDAIIAKIVDEFNRDPSRWAGSTAGQAGSIQKITAAQVKAHMIQETGGGDINSRTAWARDPLQVNVPGDWNPYKKYLGIKEPRRRNEGSFEKNLRAGIMLLARKGFGVSGQPAANRPDGAFDGWPRALQRYNGRSDKAADGRKYSEAYSERIRQRAASDAEVPIPIPTIKKR